MIEDDSLAVEPLEHVQLPATHVRDYGQVVPLLLELGEKLLVQDGAESDVEFLGLPQQRLRDNRGSGRAVGIIVTKDSCAAGSFE